MKPFRLLHENVTFSELAGSAPWKWRWHASTVFLGNNACDLKRGLMGMLHLDWERVRRLSELAVSYGNPGDSARAAGAGDTGLCGTWGVGTCPTGIPAPHPWAVLFRLLEGLPLGRNVWNRPASKLWSPGRNVPAKRGCCEHLVSCNIQVNGRGSLGGCPV